MNSSLKPSNLERAKVLPILADQMIVFPLADENYGIPIKYIREVLDSCWFTKIPKSPDIICGAINHKGKIYTILNLAELLGVPLDWHAQATNVLLFEHPEALFGVMVGKVSEITYYDEHVMKDHFYKIEKIKSPFVREIFQLDNEIIDIVEVEYLFEHLTTILASR